MLNESSPCPSPELLERLGNDSLQEVDFIGLESHVQQCPLCLAVLKRLANEGHQASDAPPEIPGFVIEGVLGRGGMSVVYQAWQPEVTRRVAIKVLTREPMNDPAERRRWLREARAMSKVRHPNVVRLYDVGEASGRLFLVLDFIPGGSLKDRADVPIAPRVAATLIETVARAVGEIHASGMFHLDIKPSNILLDGPPNGPLDLAVPILADFGLAQAGDDANNTKTTIRLGPTGTPAFMAPEQFDGKRAAIGPHTDVFALGVTLYALLTGRSPFQGATVIETLDLVRSSDPVPPRQLVPGISRDLETVVLKCLRKECNERYATANALADDLRRFLDGQPIKARPTPVSVRAVKWCRRRPAMASLLGVLAVTIVASFVGLTWLWRNSESERVRAEDALGLARKNEKLALDNEKKATSMRADLVKMLQLTIQSPLMLTPDATGEIVEKMGYYTNMLCEVPGLNFDDINMIVSLEFRLSNLFYRTGKNDEAIAILKHSQRLIERYRDPAKLEPEREESYARSLFNLGCLYQNVGLEKEGLIHLERAVNILRNAGDGTRCLWFLVGVYTLQHVTADAALSRGDRALWQRYLDANLRMSESVADAFPSVPFGQMLREVTRAESTGKSFGIAAMKQASKDLTAEDRKTDIYQGFILGWTTREVFSTSRIAELSERSDADTCATEMRAMIQASCEELGLAPEQLVRIAHQGAQRVMSIAAIYRRENKLSRAENTIKWYEKFVQKLVEQHPSEATYRILLAHAHVQHMKNAVKRDDRAAIVAHLRNGVLELKRAQRLKPNDPEIRDTLSSLQDKLLGWVVNEDDSK